MRRRAAVAVAAVAAVVLAGCGVPSETDVVVEGRGQEVRPAQGDEGTREPPGREATSDPQEFVRNFLSASAGDPQLAAQRVREFISPLARAEWKPPPAVQVVRLDGDPLISERADDIEVQVRLVHVGELGENGIVTPRSLRRVTHTLTIDAIDEEAGLYVTDPPEELLLLDTALTQYYELRTLYFWSADSTTLVPDLRYLPRRDVSTAQVPNQVIDWLLAGPSPWLRPAVTSFPPDARRVDNVPASTDNALVVRLTKAVDTANEAAVNRLATQLRWSLRAPNGSVDYELRLRIDTTDKVYRGSDYLRSNPAYRGGMGPMRLVLYDNTVHRLRPVPDGARPTPRLAEDYDAVMERVAMGRDGDRSVAAIVRVAGQNRRALDIAVGQSAELGQPRPTTLVAARMSQPVWLPGTPAMGLVAANGVLYTFRADGGAMRPLANSPSGVTAFAVPPDGRRVAYIAGGRLFVAPLLREDNQVLLGQEEERQEIPTELTQLAGVGWSQQTWLVVAGRDGDRLQFHDLTLDGAVRESRSGQFGDGEVTHLVAATDDAGDGPAPGEVLYEVNGLTFELFSQQRRLTADDLEGAGPPPADEEAKPTAPFLLD